MSPGGMSWKSTVVKEDAFLNSSSVRDPGQDSIRHRRQTSFCQGFR